MSEATITKAKREVIIDSLIIDSLKPYEVAHWLLHQPLKKILEVQTILAENGVALNIQTAEIQVVEPR